MSDWSATFGFTPWKKEEIYLFNECKSHEWEMKYLTTKGLVEANLKKFSS